MSLSIINGILNPLLKYLKSDFGKGSNFSSGDGVVFFSISTKVVIIDC